MTRHGGVSPLTSYDAIRHHCRWAVWAALAGNRERREQMRSQLESGELPADLAGWVEGERG